MATYKIGLTGQQIVKAPNKPETGKKPAPTKTDKDLRAK